MRIVNFHIGAPKLTFGLVHYLVRARSISKEGNYRLLRPRDYKKHFRGIVNGKGDISTSEIEAARLYLNNLPDEPTLVASQSSLLGQPKRVFLNGEIYPGVEKRLDRLSHILENTQLDYHLTICNCVDYLSVIAREADQGLLARQFSIATPSWHDLVVRLKSACPHRRMIVWDFEDPESVIVPFGMVMLGLEEECLNDVSNEISRWLAPTLRKTLQSFPITLSEEMSARLDVQYEIDLEKIKQLNGVVLVRPEKIPSEMKLSIR